MISGLAHASVGFDNKFQNFYKSIKQPLIYTILPPLGAIEPASLLILSRSSLHIAIKDCSFVLFFYECLRHFEL